MAEMVVERRDLARRLIHWTGLGSPLRASVAATVARLGLVQMDPMQVVAPAHLWTLSLRRGPTRLDALDRALARGEVLEALCGVRCLVNVRDAAAMVAAWRRWRGRNVAARRGVEAAARAVMRVAESGRTFTSRSLDGEGRVAGFWDPEGVLRTKATSVALDLLWREGRLAVVGRQGGQKLYGLLARHLPEVDRLIARLAAEEADALAVRHSLGTWGLLWSAGPVGWGVATLPGPRQAWLERAAAEGWAVPVRLAGAGPRRLWAASGLLEGAPPPPRRAALLAPLDNILWQRERLEQVLGLRYRWEAYVPAARRSASAYNMPVLTGDRFWGEADARWRDDRLEVLLRAADGRGAAPPPAVGRAVAAAERLACVLRGEAGGEGRGRRAAKRVAMSNDEEVLP